MARRSIGIFMLIFAWVVFCPGWLIGGGSTAQGADPSAAKASSRPMVWAVKTETRRLDPHQFDYDYDQKPQRASLEPLMEYTVMPDRSVKIVGVLAESWKGSADAKVWTFQLRKGIKFHDNTPYRIAAGLAHELSRGGEAPRCIFYEVTSPLRPNILVDISRTFKWKKKAMKCYKSQLKLTDYLDTMQAISRYRTFTLGKGIRFAEAFWESGDASEAQDIRMWLSYETPLVANNTQCM